MSMRLTHLGSGVTVQVSDEKAERLGSGWAPVAPPSPESPKRRPGRPKKAK